MECFRHALLNSSPLPGQNLARRHPEYGHGYVLEFIPWEVLRWTQCWGGTGRKRGSRRLLLHIGKSEEVLMHIARVAPQAACCQREGSIDIGAIGKITAALDALLPR